MNQPKKRNDGAPHIVVAGAGSVGCFVGGLLARGAQRVTLFTRARMADEISRQGLMLSDHDDLDEELAPDLFSLSTSPDCMADADIVLVTVKSGDTAEMAGLIAAHAPDTAVIVSLQNGVGNAAILRDAVPGRDIRGGVVAFNVVHLGGGRFHRGTSGDIYVEKGPGHLGRALSVPDLKTHERADIVNLQWGKLLLNLNNALNALSGRPLRDQIGAMGWRRIMARQIAEALAVYKAAGIKAVLPVSAPLPARFLPRLLRLPSGLFRRVAGTMLSIDPQARSSMWEDLELRRLTEIDELQGLIADMGRDYGVPTPVNARVAHLVRDLEARQEGAPAMTPRELRG